jgi:hypothetical protein
MGSTGISLTLIRTVRSGYRETAKSVCPLRKFLHRENLHGHCGGIPCNLVLHILIEG